MIDPAGALLSLLVFAVLGGAAVIHIYRKPSEED